MRKRRENSFRYCKLANLLPHTDTRFDEEAAPGIIASIVAIADLLFRYF